MESRDTRKKFAGAPAVCTLLLGSFLAPAPTTAQATPVPTPPYKISVFANSPNGISQPDSIVMWRDRIIVGFANGSAKDGSKGSSTIVEFSLNGTVKRMFTVPGTMTACG